jgi:hypothetical protein
VTHAPGILGDAARLTALTDVVSFMNSGPLLNSWPQSTLEYWVYPDQDPTAVRRPRLAAREHDWAVPSISSAERAVAKARAEVEGTFSLLKQARRSHAARRGR